MTEYKNHEPGSLTLPELCDHIVIQHHSFERKMINAIADHLKVIAEVEKNGRSEILSLQTIFLQLTEKLEQHITTEEKLIFPFAEKFTSLGKEEHLAHFSELRHTMDLLLKLCKRQKNILDDIKDIRDLTHNFNPLIEHSPTHKLCLEELQRLELNIQQHFSLVNNELVKKMEEIEDRVHQEEQLLKNGKHQ